MDSDCKPEVPAKRRVTSVPDAIPAWKVQYDADLEPWEDQFARWLARNDELTEEQEAVAVRQFYGADLSKSTVKAVKKKYAFQDAFETHRAEHNEQFLRRAKNQFHRAIPKAIDTYSKALDVANKKLDSDEESMSALRTIAGLVTPAFDRTIPRRTETSTVATHITITLTPEQIVGMNAPVLVVEADEVKPAQLPAAT